MDYAATNARPPDNVTPPRVIALADVLGAGMEISVPSVRIFSYRLDTVFYIYGHTFFIVQISNQKIQCRFNFK